MNTVTLTKTPARTCAVSWCNGDHGRSRSYLDHGSDGLLEGRLFARISWAEPLDAAARYLDVGTEVYLAVGDAGVVLPLRNLGDMARMLEASGAGELAGFVRRVLAAAAGEGGAA